jgi:hypothetical protein
MTRIRRAKAWAGLMRRLRRAVVLTPPTPEEADAAMAGAEEFPMSEAEIQRIADNVTERGTQDHETLPTKNRGRRSPAVARGQ